MTTTNHTEGRAWHIEYAKRSLADLNEKAQADLRERIERIRRRLDEAERSLDRGELPSRCGILQNSAVELEMALARLTALHDAQYALDIITDSK